MQLFHLFEQEIQNRKVGENGLLFLSVYKTVTLLIGFPLADFDDDEYL